MTTVYSALVLGASLCLAALVAPALQIGSQVPWGSGSAHAEPAGSVEKDAFEAAKSLGTVEAWDAFLSNYPKGFHADLARAYVKKLADQPQPPASVPAPIDPNNDFPVEAGSWGGVVRDGPGQQYAKVDSLDEGERITLMGRTDAIENGYPWFKIVYRDSGTGYKWGGILCSTGAERPDLFKVCTTAPPSEKKKAAGCKDGGEWDGLRCRPAGFFGKGKTCKARETYVPEAGRCVDLEAQEDGEGEINNPPKKKKKKTFSQSAACRELGLILKNGSCVAYKKKDVQRLKKQKKIGCPPGTYLNPLGQCQPNETGG